MIYPLIFYLVDIFLIAYKNQQYSKNILITENRIEYFILKINFQI